MQNAQTFKPIARISKIFAALLIIFKVPIKLFRWPDKIIFWFVSSKILCQQNDVSKIIFSVYVKDEMINKVLFCDRYLEN